MKRYIFPLVMLILLIPAVSAFAGGYLGWPVNKNAPIQNLTGIGAGSGRCDTTTGTKAVQKNYSTAGFIGGRAQAFNPTTGAAVVGKWYEDGVQVAVDSAYAFTSDQGKAMTTLSYKDYSSASHTTGTCIRRQ
jgi:hypothetical protein